MQQYLEGIKIAFSGAGTTLVITGVAVVLGVIIGLIIAMWKISHRKILRIIASVYIEVIRGTPLIVQALLAYYGLPMLLQSYGINFRWSTAIIAGIIVCGMNSSAYVAEIIRAGLQAVDKGQAEAARSLGMTNGQAMRLIIIPQAFKVIIPALGNEFITLIKETAVLSVITIEEITRKSMLWAASTFIAFPAYIGTAIMYMSLTIPLSKLMGSLERKMTKDVKS